MSSLLLISVSITLIDQPLDGRPYVSGCLTGGVCDIYSSSHCKGASSTVDEDGRPFDVCPVLC